jgi:hypothetical protein
MWEPQKTARWQEIAALAAKEKCVSCGSIPFVFPTTQVAELVRFLSPTHTHTYRGQGSPRQDSLFPRCLCSDLFGFRFLSALPLLACVQRAERHCVNDQSHFPSTHTHTHTHDAHTCCSAFARDFVRGSAILRFLFPCSVCDQTSHLSLAFSVFACCCAFDLSALRICG